MQLIVAGLNCADFLVRSLPVSYSL